MCVGRYARLVVKAKEETPVAQTFPVSVATHPNSYAKSVSQLGVWHGAQPAIWPVSSVV